MEALPWSEATGRAEGWSRGEAKMFEAICNSVLGGVCKDRDGSPSGIDGKRGARDSSTIRIRKQATGWNLYSPNLLGLSEVSIFGRVIASCTKLHGFNTIRIRIKSKCK